MEGFSYHPPLRVFQILGKVSQKTPNVERRYVAGSNSLPDPANTLGANLSRKKTMKQEHEIYIQVEDADGPSLVKVHDDDTIATLLERLRSQHPHLGHEPELMVVFPEDAEEEVGKDVKFCDCHPHRPKILHCHRCREIKVTVSYNGVESESFKPNAKIRRVTKWAVDEFKVDAGRKWVLRTGSAEGDILDPDTRVGQLVKFPNCSLQLYLTERCLIQG